ncbi:MAG: GTPase ObgE [Clostridia bacterium]|nr:GTPase ObgE [Clostridia bacterium]
MLIDQVKIYVRSGDGGNGSVSFHREKYVAQGGPDGGDGGNGGSVVFYVDPGDNTLLKYKYKRKFVAENGGNGKGDKFHGARGKDLRLPVPPGTVIKDAESGKVIKDLSEIGEEFVLLKGGKGGWGNRHFATSTRQVPRFAKNGTRGKEAEVILELKMIADVGLIGLPNVGKSSILAAISDARPRIANYHFTTLSPNLGVVRIGDGCGFVAADIPGLIEGASEGAGLGHDFLRHVDRCRLLIHVVDVSMCEGRDPVEDIKTINEELRAYSKELSSRPQIIAANKCDCIDETLFDRAAFEEFASKNSVKLVYVSAMTGENLDGLVHAAAELLKDLPEITRYESEMDLNGDTLPDDRSVEIRNVNGVYYVEAEWLYNLMGGINFDDRESLMYFQRVLRSSGVIAALVEKGCKDGDTVNMYDFEFDFMD